MIPKKKKTIIKRGNDVLDFKEPIKAGSFSMLIWLLMPAVYLAAGNANRLLRGSKSNGWDDDDGNKKRYPQFVVSLSARKFHRNCDENFINTRSIYLYSNIYTNNFV